VNLSGGSQEDLKPLRSFLSGRDFNLGSPEQTSRGPNPWTTTRDAQEMNPFKSHVETLLTYCNIDIALGKLHTAYLELMKSKLLFEEGHIKYAMKTYLT
jgi:hypothetical protein